MTDSRLSSEHLRAVCAALRSSYRHKLYIIPLYGVSGALTVRAADGFEGTDYLMVLVSGIGLLCLGVAEICFAVMYWFRHRRLKKDYLVSVVLEK